MITSKDVARLSGVSQATVSRVLSNPDRVSPTLRRNVYEAMRMLNYVPHRGAQTLRGGRTSTVGIVVDDLLNPAMPLMLDEVTHALDAVGYRAIIWNANMSQSSAVRAIQERSIDGLIFTTATELSPELQAAIALGSPIVLINRTVDSLDCDKVVSRNTQGAFRVAEYLTKHAKRTVAFIEGPPIASTARQRSDTFILRMAELGNHIPVTRRFNGEFSYERASEVARLMLADDNPPDAIFCANDYMALGAIDAVRQHRASGGAECWVVGFDDIPMASWPAFDLTTVRQPFPEMVKKGVSLLLDRIENPDRKAQTIEFDCELVVRGSTGFLGP